MRIYLACALTHVPRSLFDDYSDFLHQLAGHLRADLAPSQVKYALIDSDPDLALKPAEERARLCYLQDRKMVEEADLVIAEVSFPGIGLGIELEIAQAKHIPVLLCFRNYGQNQACPVRYANPDGTSHSLQIGEGFISLMALGLPMVRGIVRYENAQEGLRGITEAVHDFASTWRGIGE